MASGEQLKLAESWLTVQRNWWASEELERMCDEYPMEAWAVVLVMLELTEDVELLTDIGANPLEYLIEHHGSLLVDAVESRAK